MKILILPVNYPNVYNPLSGIFFRDHALALQAVGHEVTVLAVMPIYLKDIWRQKRLSFGLVKQNESGILTYVYTFPTISQTGWWNNLLRTLIGWRLYRSIRRRYGHPDLVHVHSFTAGDLARRIKRIDGIRYAITEHSTVFAREKLSFTQERLAPRVFKDASVRTAVSVPFAQLLTERYGYSFVYTPNPVDKIELINDSEKRALKTNPGKIRICNVAFCIPSKRQNRLIRAFSSVIEKFPEAELHIAGDGPQKKYLADLVSELDLESGVVFHSMLQRQDVFKLMRSCDLFALSSDFETFGVVLIEAMSCGLPIVATRCGGPESIITEDWLGILTERDDDSFTKGLLNGVKEVQNKRFDSQRISTHVRDTYSYQAIGKMMTNLYLTSTLFI